MIDTKESYWKVLYSPDENGILTQVTFIQTTWKGLDSLSQAERNEADQMQDYCYRTYGNKVYWVNGIQPVRNWVLHAISDGEYINVEALNHPSSKLTPYKHHFNIGFKNGGMAVAK